MAATDKPARVNLDLDTLDREHVRGLPEKRDPFVVNISDKVITFKDPVEIDALVLMRLFESPVRFFKGTLDNEGYTHVVEQLNKPGALPGWKLRGLMQNYQAYFGLDEMGNFGAA